MDNPPTDGTLSPTTIEQLATYIEKVAMLHLQVNSAIPFDRLVALDEVKDSIIKFAQESKYPAICVSKFYVAGDSECPEYLKSTSTPLQTSEEEAVWLNISLDIQYLGDGSQGIVFTKKNSQTFSSQLDVDKSISSLLQIFEIGDTSVSPPDSLLQYLSSAFEPYFYSYARYKYNYTKDDSDSKIGIPSVFNSLNELYSALTNWKQNTAIPELNLMKHVHPLIRELCAKRQSIEDLGDKLNDHTFLNELQHGIKECVKDIRQITEHRDVPFKTIMEGLSYWGGLEKALSNIDSQLKADEFSATLKILQKTRRFHAAVSLTADTSINSSLEKARLYHGVLKDLPIQELIAAKDVEEISIVIEQIFIHSKKKSKELPVDFLVHLIQAISHDLAEQLHKVLGNRKLLNLYYEEFDRATAGCDSLFAVVSAQIKQFTSIFVSIKTKYGSKGAPKLQLQHQPLHVRIQELRNFRRQHEELRLVIERVLPPSFNTQANINAIEEVNNAYEDIKNIDKRILDTSKEGNEVWSAALKTYNSRIDRVETHITNNLRDKLGTAKNASEMFRIFAKFNPLFCRPKIQSAIHEYQEQLIEKVKDDIKKLREKFTERSSSPDARYMTDLWDLPTVSGFVIWARQIRRQLDLYMKRVDAVFGKGWERLIALRRPNKSWLLDEHLADFMGIPFTKLQSQINQSALADFKPEVQGTALALAFLENVFGDFESEYTIHAKESSAFLHAEEKKAGSLSSDSVTMAKTLLTQLGVGMQHVEGQKIRAEAELFKRKLNENIDQKISDWTKEVTECIKKWGIFEIKDNKAKAKGNIFEVRQKEGDDYLELEVNFHPGIETLMKEMRNLTWLNMLTRVGETIISTATTATELHPHAVSLIESVNTFKKASERLSPDIYQLMAEPVNMIHKKLKDGFNLTWDKGQNDNYSKELSELTRDFHDKVNSLIHKNEQIHRAMDNLKTCPLRQEHFREILSRIQGLVDELDLASYSNLKKWVKNVDKEIEDILVERLKETLTFFVEEFHNMDNPGQARAEAAKSNVPPPPGLGEDFEIRQRKAMLSNLNMAPFQIELQLHNRTMHVEPPLEKARVHWLGRLHACIAWICDLSKIQSSRYNQANIREKRGSTDTYRTLLGKLPEGMLRNAYESVENKIGIVSGYLTTWLQYQSLWDMELNTIYDQLGDDATMWLELIECVKGARSVIDNKETSKNYGAIVIDYQKVQNKVNMKYDDTLRELLTTFREKLAQSVTEFYDTISGYRHKLEAANFEANLGDAVSFLGLLQVIKKNYPKWENQVSSFKAGQDMLQKHRVRLPQDWIDADNIEGEWSAFNEILKRRNESMAKIRKDLVNKIMEDDQQLEQDLDQYAREWKDEKPLDGAIKVDKALAILNNFDSRLNNMRNEIERIYKAKEALDLDIREVDRLDPFVEELSDFKEVWNALRSIWDSLKQLRDTPFNSITHQALRSRLDEILNSIKQLPASMRQFAAVDFAKRTVKSYTGVNLIIHDLRSDAMKDRHWKELMKRLKVRWTLSDLTLGHVWDADIKKNEGVFKEVIRTAMGEQALENFFEQITDYWSSFQLEMVDYKRKCHLIRGWDDLFNKVGEHLNSLSAMRMSPFFKVFEDQCSAWEDKLNRIRIIFDIWVDVQRRWVYLEGVFMGNADIKHQLPRESQRFATLDKEFVALMRDVYKSRAILDVLGFKNLQKNLEKISNLLTSIQRALGEYLEKQRAAFPRFYFVGDEDLLEIVGQSTDPRQVLKHLKKMFAGIGTLLMNDDATEVLGMASNEGEEVMFRNTISLSKSPKINEWLSAVEMEMRHSLASILSESVVSLEALYKAEPFDQSEYLKWMTHVPAQLVVLSSQIVWTHLVDSVLKRLASKGAVQSSVTLQDILNKIMSILEILADLVLIEKDSRVRKKQEFLITELVHQRDVLRKLIKEDVSSPRDFAWLYYMRFYWDNGEDDLLKRLKIETANAEIYYGYEYLGVQDRLVQTPLTDRAYLTLTQALNARLGGSPFGPAGTGKTETVKALGSQLGRFVLVFNCDENFDFKAMGRIFVGLCQCGAWGCFDEFNRLEERILSAVSQQIQTIQEALRDRVTQIELIGRDVKVNFDTGIFVTMNPGYAGRSNLPDNLKQLFRAMAMVKPDREMIAQVMLFSQGFKTAEMLASKVVPFFQLCKDQLSQQSHYDFGLRALKSVLVNSGNLKRQAVTEGETGDQVDETERKLLIRSISETMIPKLVGDDILLFKSLLQDVFPGTNISPAALTMLREKIQEVCKEHFYIYEDKWVEKIIQLYQIQSLQHGVMLVGPSGCGKTSAWQVLLEAMRRMDGVDGQSYLIDPKSISKDELYGNLDKTTREWQDGIFTHTLRKIVDNVRGESAKRHWIIFDGDVDPEWVENLNSVLDDNKLLTLPNGERLSIPSNVRIMFEVENLKYATLATVSRCGMVWFSEEVNTLAMIFDNYLTRLRSVPVTTSDAEYIAASAAAKSVGVESHESNISKEDAEILQVQKDCADILEPFFQPGELVVRTLAFAAEQEHVMDFTRLRVLTSLFSILNYGVIKITEYNAGHPYFPMDRDHIERFITKHLLFSLVWGMGGSMSIKARFALGQFMSSVTTLPMPSGELINFQINMETGEWQPWSDAVPTVEVETQKCESVNEVIPTVDTVRHVEVLKSWLAQHKPLLLCGPPGSGKTMTLTSVLNHLPDYDVVFLNFSSATQPGMILKTFEQYCEFVSTQDGTIMRPVQAGKWLVVFCDEINLPATDKYGTQRVITFIRQLVEQGGFWRAKDLSWVKIERIQFVGACNPPTDPGRIPLSHRFLRHAPLLLVDFPAEESLHQIYGTFSRALLRPHAHLKNYAEPLTQTMVEIYQANQEHFSADMQPHYIYSPRELSRWIRALYEAMRPQSVSFSTEDFVRLVAHEGLRLFQDRLVQDTEREWEDEAIDKVVFNNFPTIDRSCLNRPILFSNWLTKDYISVDKEELRAYTQARLKSFAEEELEVQLVVFDSVLDHVLRIDRVLRQPLGHLLLVGVSGSGKTVLSRFVAWMIGLSVFQIKAHRKYTLDDFEEDLRSVMKRAGCKDEKICFIFDESNVLDNSFLEYMNALLASGEVPGLFEGDDYTSLMHSIKEAIPQNLILDSEDEMYRWFISRVQRNLHVVFTMNPAGADFHDRSATSPALFNRCVIDWFGEWSQSALMQVAAEFTSNMDLQGVLLDSDQDINIHESVTNSIVSFHNIVKTANDKLAKRQGPKNFLTPRQYLDFIQQFRGLYGEKREELQEQQLHLNQGLAKLRDTEEEVAEMRISLTKKEAELREKDSQANEKLKQMVKDQQEAEDKKKESEKLQEQLEVQSKDIEVRKSKAQEELSEALPALQEAQQAVKTIRKRDLDELRQLRSPPAAVKKTLEAVSIVVFKAKSVEWQEISRLMRRDDFISSIATFDPQSMSVRARRKAKEYLSDPGLEYDLVNRASKAAGPLIKWLKSQIRYADILHSIEPLQKEVDTLEEQFQELQAQSEEINDTITELEDRIAIYKEEYASLIRETETIKVDMQKVKSKVDRSTSLLQSLSEERGRWEFQSKNFETQMSTVIGDVLLSSSFLAYIGFFDEHFRHRVLLPKWQDQLNIACINFKDDISLIEYLSIPDDRLTWSANKLPNDDLCVENAIMLHRFNRYPLVIDPSGQATEFLMNQFRDKNITKTSFLDDSFMKHLESALRFGYPLLVQDVENIDPILNPILNKEVRRTGGRNLIRLGDQDIDFSPSFSLYLTTRDPTFQFTPDVCSRVTFVNFTVTPASLQSQCLNQIIKAESPEIDQKRSDMLKLQGEYKVRLRSLEHKLLNAISNAQVNILEDEQIIGTLEKLKTEASEVTQKMKETETVMVEIQTATEKYSPLATACSRVYFSLDSLSEIHFLYHFSLKFFFDIVNDVLHKNKNLEGVRGQDERLAIVFQDLFVLAFERTTRSMLHEDHLAFALRLAQIKLAANRIELDVEDVDFLLKAGGKAGDLEAKILASMPSGTKLSSGQLQLANELSALPSFKNLLSHISANQEEWQSFMQQPNAHANTPQCFTLSNEQEETRLFKALLVLKVFRPDALAAGATEFTKTIFHDDFFHLPELKLDTIVKEETDSYTPLMLCSMPGFDASGRIEDLAAETSKQYRAIAMGSAEGFEQADEAINRATKSGTWVLLKNVHLSPNWLSQLEKLLHGLQLERKTNPNFRLFMTAEVHPKLPANLLRRAHVFVFEPPPGVKANLSHTFTSTLSNTQRVDRPPAERSRLHLMASWFHAVVQERLRYAPVGWSKMYEFNESDLKYSLDTIDTWVSIAAKERDNVNPEHLPWQAITTLLGESIYGGRIDNDFDHLLLKSFLKSFFDPECYDEEFKLFSSTHDSMNVPEGTRRVHFVEWIDKLPERETPEWLGLPNNASLMIRTREGTHTLLKLLKIQSLDENETAFEAATDIEEQFTGPTWARAVIPLVRNWMELLPAEMKPKAMGDLKHPLSRFYAREVSLGISLLSTIRRDLQELLDISNGTSKITNYYRSLVNSLAKGSVPDAWIKFPFLETISLNEWILDFSKRMKQLASIVEGVRNNDYKQAGVWLGGLFAPGAFITATRQSVAQAHQWSLELLELEVEIGEDRVIDDQCFIIEGLTLVSADYREGALRLTEQLTTKLPPTRFRWVKKSERKQNSHEIQVPLYLNSSRQEVMTAITLNTDENLPSYIWYQRGTAVLSWSRE